MVCAANASPVRARLPAFGQIHAHGRQHDGQPLRQVKDKAQQNQLPLSAQRAGALLIVVAQLGVFLLAAFDIADQVQLMADFQRPVRQPQEDRLVENQQRQPG